MTAATIRFAGRRNRTIAPETLIDRLKPAHR